MNLPELAIKDHKFIKCNEDRFSFPNVTRFKCEICGILCIVPKNINFIALWADSPVSSLAHEYKFWYCIEYPFPFPWNDVPTLYNLSCVELQIRDIIL